MIAAVSYHNSVDDRRETGGGAGFALIIVIGVTLGAFYAAGAGVFEGPPAVQLHVGSHLAVSRPNTDHPQLNQPAKSSIAAFETPATLACNYAACSEAYRSFDASDCSYQPYNGPRRQCRK